MRGCLLLGGGKCVELVPGHQVRSGFPVSLLCQHFRISSLSLCSSEKSDDFSIVV